MRLRLWQWNLAFAANVTSAWPARPPIIATARAAPISSRRILRCMLASSLRRIAFRLNSVLKCMVPAGGFCRRHDAYRENVHDVTFEHVHGRGGFHGLASES